MQGRLLRTVGSAGALALAAGLAGCPPPVTGSRCYVEDAFLICPHETARLNPTGEPRDVHWQVPLGAPPAGGWPAVLMFQGTLATAELTWSATPLYPLGGYYQTQVVQNLLDSGFAVLTPETHLGGLTFWDTNNPLIPDYYGSSDHFLVLAILDEIAAGRFGALDPTRLFATGISSGGYMTSRMAISYPGRFRALAVMAGSYATCIGPLCALGPIPADHPPTLFLHGALDPIVPIGTMYPYELALRQMGVPTRLAIDPLAFHEWTSVAPLEIVDWFEAYLP